MPPADCLSVSRCRSTCLYIVGGYRFSPRTKIAIWKKPQICTGTIFFAGVFTRTFRSVCPNLIQIMLSYSHRLLNRTQQVNILGCSSSELVTINPESEPAVTPAEDANHRFRRVFERTATHGGIIKASMNASSASLLLLSSCIPDTCTHHMKHAATITIFS